MSKLPYVVRRVDLADRRAVQLVTVLHAPFPHVARGILDHDGVDDGEEHEVDAHREQEQLDQRQPVERWAVGWVGRRMGGRVKGRMGSQGGWGHTRSEWHDGWATLTRPAPAC